MLCFLRKRRESSKISENLRKCSVCPLRFVPLKRALIKSDQKVTFWLPKWLKSDFGVQQVTFWSLLSLFTLRKREKREKRERERERETWWAFRPRKKILSSPPPPQILLAHTPPTPPPSPPLVGEPRPPLGLFNKKKPTPAPSRRLGLRLPLPRAEKNKKYSKTSTKERKLFLFSLLFESEKWYLLSGPVAAFRFHNTKNTIGHA